MIFRFDRALAQIFSSTSITKLLRSNKGYSDLVVSTLTIGQSIQLHSLISYTITYVTAADLHKHNGCCEKKIVQEI